MRHGHSPQQLRALRRLLQARPAHAGADAGTNARTNAGATDARTDAGTNAGADAGADTHTDARTNAHTNARTDSRSDPRIGTHTVKAFRARSVRERLLGGDPPPRLPSRPARASQLR